MGTKIISILNQKGGAGKTTIATNLAYFFSFVKGFTTILVDSDPQGSARDWNDANNSAYFPVVGIDRPTLALDVPKIIKPYDVAIIDGAPHIENICISAIKISDCIIIPVQPSPYDIWATSHLVELVKARQEMLEHGPLAFFLVSRAIKNSHLSQEVINALKDYDLPVLEHMTTQRVSYPTTASKGESVLQGSDSSAIEEIKSVGNEILNKVRYGA